MLELMNNVKKKGKNSRNMRKNKEKKPPRFQKEVISIDREMLFQKIIDTRWVLDMLSHILLEIEKKALERPVVNTTKYLHKMMKNNMQLNYSKSTISVHIMIANLNQ